MNKKEWEQIQIIVDEALTLSGNEQQTFVEEACKGSAKLLNEVKEFLASIEESERINFLENPGKEHFELINDLSENLKSQTDFKNLVGEKIGPYQVKELINRGGMGSVYKAIRIDGQFDQTVAIKFLNQRNISNHSISRFESEKKILANVSHPNIGLILDGGISKEGSPFLIMEFIDGQPIDEYCIEHKLTLQERLDLFEEVLSAIQFAHSNLIIHRDLKPSNILVNKEGNIKILDFGIAKLLDDESSIVDANITQQGQRLWTPQCAAPEQIKGESVTTATDVYALGILLHKLITNKYPFDFSDKSITEVENIIKEIAPTLPSNSISIDEDSSKPILTSKILKGDLDAIVLKALRKEPEYRYNSIGQLSEDLRRYEIGLPILARKDTINYRVEKFFRRHKVGIAVTMSVILIISSLVGFYTWRITEEKQAATLEAKKATEIAQYLSDLFSRNFPENAQGEDITAKQLLKEGVNSINNLDNQPDVKVTMLNLFSSIYHSLEEIELSDSLANASINFNKDLENVDELELAASYYVLALINRDKGNYSASIDFFERSLAHEELTNTAADSNYSARLSSLAYVYRLEGKLEEAVLTNKEAIAIQKRLYGEQNIRLAETYYIQASILRVMGKFDEATVYQMKSYDMLLDLVDSPHPGLAANLSNIALLESKKENFAKSEEYNRKALKMVQELYGENHSAVSTSLSNLGQVLKEQQKYDEALLNYNKAINILKNNLGEGHLNLTTPYRNMGNLFIIKKRYNEADSLLNLALDIQTEKLGKDHLRNSYVLNSLGNLELERGNSALAKKYYNECLSIRKQVLGDNHPDTKSVQEQVSKL